MPINPNQGLTVYFPSKISQTENIVAISLLNYAKEHPEVVEYSVTIPYNTITYPGGLASKLFDCDPTAEEVSLPIDVFRKIINKLVQAELRCSLTGNDGMNYTANAPYLPVQIIDTGDDILLQFTEQPQCYFDVVDKEEYSLCSIKPCNEMLQFMRDFVDKYFKKE